MKRINLTALENIIKEQNKNTKIIINYKDNSTVFYINDNYYLTNNGDTEAAVIEYLNNNNYRYNGTLGEDKEVYSYKKAVNAWNK